MAAENDIEYTQDFIINNTFDWATKFDKMVKLINKIIKKSKKLGDDFVIENSAAVAEAYEIKEYITNDNNTKNSFKFVNTGTIDRYSILWGVCETQYINEKYKYPVIKKEIIRQKFPQRYNQALKEKIIVAGMVKRLEFCYDNSADILSGKSTLTISNKKDNLYNLKYILALLNSTLYDLIFKSFNKYNAMSGGYMNVGKKSLTQFIYYPINLKNSKEKEINNKLVNLVDNIIAINKKIVAENNPDTKTILQRQISTIDLQIDKLVYELYDLNDDEIKLIKS